MSVRAGGMGSVLMVTIGFTSSLVGFHTVVGSLRLEVFSVCVREAQAETDRCKKDSRTQIWDSEDSEKKVKEKVQG